MLSGGGGDTEAMFPHITHFSEQFRVIAPNYPTSYKTLSDIISGLRALLSQEGIEHCVVVGFSFGGMLAQLYIRRFQDMVTDLVVSHSMIPSRHLSEAMSMQYQLLRLYPEALLLWMSKRAFHNQIANTTCPITDDARTFWQTYIDESYSQRMSKRDLVLRARLTAEYHAGDEFNSRDLLHWHGDLLLIESDNDDVINDGDRGSFKAMYSRAYVQTLANHDHLAPLLVADQISQSILNFLHKDED
ncbi:MAG: alpha/beta hydrolase [Chloroflexota bacterium]